MTMAAMAAMAAKKSHIINIKMCNKDEQHREKRRHCTKSQRNHLLRNRFFTFDLVRPTQLSDAVRPTKYTYASSTQSWKKKWRNAFEGIPALSMSSLCVDEYATVLVCVCVRRLRRCWWCHSLCVCIPSSTFNGLIWQRQKCHCSSGINDSNYLKRFR